MRWKATVVPILLAVAVVPSAHADPLTQLAERYAPVVRLVEQEHPCGHGEAFVRHRLAEQERPTGDVLPAEL